MVLGYALTKKGIELREKQSVKVDDLIAELDRIFGKVSFTKKHLKRMYGNSYEPKFGFRVVVQRLHGLLGSQKGLVHFVVSQFVPPGRLLRPEKTMGPDIHVFKDQDFNNSPWNSIQF